MTEKMISIKMAVHLNEKKNTNQPQSNKRQGEKRNYKEKKFGFGGKKKGSKMNDKQSVNDISGYRRPKLPGAKGGNAGVKGGKGKGGKNKRNQRMGKMRRQKHKGKNKRNQRMGKMR